MANGKQSGFHRLSCPEIVLALLKLFKQICCLKRGKGFPGAVFAERLKVFSSKQISLKAHFHHRLRNVWKNRTSDRQRALWQFMGWKSNRRGKYSLAAFRKVLSGRGNHVWSLYSCLHLAAGSFWLYLRLKPNHRTSCPAHSSPAFIES